MAESSISDMISEALESIKQLAGVNTIIGDPIITQNGTTVIPVSKVSMGFASGGVDYPAGAEEAKASAQQQAAKARKQQGSNFGGGGGTGITVAPIGFLVIKPDGDVEMLNVGAPQISKGSIESVTDLIERSPDIISRIKSVFTKGDGASSSEELSITEVDGADDSSESSSEPTKL